MKPTKTPAADVLMSTWLVAMYAAEKQGPAEKAGESLDAAAESFGERIEDAGDAPQDAAKGKN